ncbi:zinc finger BED domain-containing protein RICESLEEPER 3-like [Triticum urartu]|uniref:zinc finger BED domain-containing protein RICESLEEPER 3-like n=1 Tax=Triticum urartu TaxID=4572 RepID=UPI0020443384|nr:zinc finger BED domain-containing protein RICESLEEPER 3-like [Triticum urartu]XP_048548597.1 zinc finger BED domain-containing protein RICESLEEPER 3-like [Triticum urartu]
MVARRAAKHPNRDTNTVQVDVSMHDTSHTTTPMDEDGDHVIVSDDEEEDDVEEVEVLPSKRKLTSKVGLEMKKMRINSEWKAKCNWCPKVLTAGSRNGTKHLRLHLNICTLKKLKTKGGKTLSQSSLKVSAEEDGKVSMESYTFDQDYARVELGNMLVLHDYPLSMVDHVGFRRFVAALQPLFKLHTRNTIRYDIVGRYKMERKKAIEYMSMIQSRVAVTTDMWTSNSQKKGYMAITAHFIDESWRLRNILMRYIVVKALNIAPCLFSAFANSQTAVYVCIL